MRPPALAMLLILPLLGGCFKERNTRPYLSQDIGLTTLEPETALASADVPSRRGSLDLYRRNWPTQTFLVPVDGTDHLYLGRTDSTCTTSTARQRREYPTGETALELDGGSGGRQVFEAVEAPFWAAGDAILLLPRYVYWIVVNRAAAVSPDIDYVRYPTWPLDTNSRAIWLGEGTESAVR